MTPWMRRTSTGRGGQPSASSTPCSTTRTVSSLRARIGYPGRIAQEPRAEAAARKAWGAIDSWSRPGASRVVQPPYDHAPEWAGNPAVHSFRHAILLGWAPPPAQGALGIVTSRRRSPGSGTASPRRIHECLAIESTRARHITAMPAGRRSYPEQPTGPAKDCGRPLSGCGSPRRTPAKGGTGPTRRQP